MSSGTSVKIDPEVREKWSQLKNDKTIIFLILKIEDGWLKLDTEGPAPEGETSEAERSRVTTPEIWGEFREKLSTAADAKGGPGARYALYDLRFENANNKPIFIAWVPDGAGVRIRMVYAAAKESLKREMGGEGFDEIQANDNDDIEFETVKKTLGRRAIV